MIFFNKIVLVLFLLNTLSLLAQQSETSKTKKNVQEYVDAKTNLADYDKINYSELADRKYKNYDSKNHSSHTVKRDDLSADKKNPADEKRTIINNRTIDNSNNQVENNSIPLADKTNSISTDVKSNDNEEKINKGQDNLDLSNQITQSKTDINSSNVVDTTLNSIVDTTSANVVDTILNKIVSTTPANVVDTTLNSSVDITSSKDSENKSNKVALQAQNNTPVTLDTLSNNKIELIKNEENKVPNGTITTKSPQKQTKTSENHNIKIGFKNTVIKQKPVIKSIPIQETQREQIIKVENKKSNNDSELIEQFLKSDMYEVIDDGKYIRVGKKNK